MKKNFKNKVADHYTISGLGNQILKSLEAAGRDINQLTVDDLAPVDEFHLRGRIATEELLKLADLQPEFLVLDVGSGLGGTSRYLASTVDCKVIGLDLTEEYCLVAEMLSDKVGLSDRTVFKHGSALELPFPDSYFDVVWTEYVQMNIRNKKLFYSEMKRVLKPDGRIVFHDIFAGNNGNSLEFHFPVPWAADSSISYLIDINDLELIFEELELVKIHWIDKTHVSINFLDDVLKKVDKDGWMPVGLHLLMGDNAETKFNNLLKNLRENRIRILQSVIKKSTN